MNHSFNEENKDLEYAWDRFNQKDLDQYLVSNVEDPRINIQSILNRAYLIDTLWPDTYTNEIYLEIRFGTIMTWLLKQIESGQSVNEIRSRIENNNVPQVVQQTSRWLQQEDCNFPDFITMSLEYTDPSQVGFTFSEIVLNIFCEFWKDKLSNQKHESIDVLEAACGSANDYRFLTLDGLAGFIHYTGIDISKKNISNAKRRFPHIDFICGSVLDPTFHDNQFQYTYAFDLLEHLSSEACNFVLDELIRITKKEIWLHFFNTYFGPDDIVNKTECYHWNTISIPRLEAYLSSKVKYIDFLPISNFLDIKFGFKEYYNKNSTTLHITL